MDKILQSVGDRNNTTITITNDGATILKSVPIENPAAKVFIHLDDTDYYHILRRSSNSCSSLLLRSWWKLQRLRTILSAMVLPV